MVKLFLGEGMKKVLKIFYLCVLIGSFITLYYLGCFLLPKINLYHSNDLTVYDNNSEILFESHHELNGKYLALNQISDNVIEAFIASEDKNFYKHHGYDIKGLIRASFNTIFLNKKQGGSTITQQLARSLFLNNDKTVKRKLKEAIFTGRIETNYTKKQILEEYLNTIYLGHDLYGVGVASRYYFNKECYDLSLDEACMLAGIASAPAYNDPSNHYENAINRRNYILNNLYESKVISKECYLENINKQTIINITNQAFDDENLFYQREIIKELKKLNLYTKENLAVGMDIYVSIDKNISKSLYEVLSYHKPITDTQVSAIILKPNSNDILAMSGGVDMDDEFNRVFMARRMIGSTIKPMIYYMALNYGLTPVSKFLSAETTFSIDGIGTYSPKNNNNVYPNHKITMIEALAVSDNIYATKALLFLGSKNLNNFLKMFNLNYDYSLPSMALGVNEMTLLELASIYNTFASIGVYYKPTLIKKVVDKMGNILYESNSKSSQLLDPTTTLVLNQLLRAPFDNNAYGYAKPTLLNYQPNAIFAAKTGSTNSDSYLVSYNPNFTIAIWVGKDNNSTLFEINLAKDIFVDLANKIVSKDKQYDWYNHGYFIEALKVNPLSGNVDNNGSFYWFKS